MKIIYELGFVCLCSNSLKYSEITAWNLFLLLGFIMICLVLKMECIALGIYLHSKELFYFMAYEEKSFAMYFKDVTLFETYWKSYISWRCTATAYITAYIIYFFYNFIHIIIASTIYHSFTETYKGNFLQYFLRRIIAVNTFQLLYHLKCNHFFSYYFV